MTLQEFIDRYKYDTQNDYLGGGGFGKVFRAYDEVLNRDIAIKIAEVKRGQESLSLLKEVELAGKLPQHKNIAHYQSCNRFDTPQGSFDYGILQYYPLGNLSTLIKSQQLQPADKELIANGIIEGIGHLHKHEVVHRDLKSSNILIAKSRAKRYVPKIADFGLSKQLQNTEQSYFSNSFAGGSLLYVAPEQLAGDAKISKNVDLWSLGVVLFELFTGNLPFYPEEANVASETGRSEIVRKINTAEFSEKEFKKIPEKWQHLIQACLVVDRKKRIGSISKLKKQFLTNTAASSSGNTVDVQDTMVDDPKAIDELNPGAKSKSLLPVLLTLGGLVLMGVFYMVWGRANTVSEQTLVPYEAEGRFGYQYPDGTIIIPARYDFAMAFNDGKAKVNAGDSIYYINNSGQIVEVIKPDPMVVMKQKAERIKQNQRDAKRTAELAEEKRKRDQLEEDKKKAEAIATAERASRRKAEEELAAAERAAANQIVKKQLYGVKDIYNNKYDYDGYTKNNLPDGYGKATFKDKKYGVYEGYFIQGKRHGQGTQTWPSGDKYTGAWKDHKKHGQGTYTWPNGNKYTGAWKDHKKHGQGTFTWADGDKYTGAWKDDKKHGQGTYNYASGNKYTGTWKDNKKDGQGTFTWASGDKYTGAWKDGDMHGQGTYIANTGTLSYCPDCIKYKGSWLNDEKSGQGKCYDKAGKLLYSGPFKDGKPVETYPNQ